MVTDFKCYFHLPFGISMIFYGCSSLIFAAMPIYQRKPREVAKNQMLDNNTSCAIRELRSAKMTYFNRFGPIFEKNSF